MKTDNPFIKSISRIANIGLWGSLLISALTVALHYLPVRVTMDAVTNDAEVSRRLMLFGLVVAVAVISFFLFYLRREIPRVRQKDTVDERLVKYKNIVRTVYVVTLFAIVVVCAIEILTGESTLIMLLLLMFIMLMLNYPNMYKMKSDMGLNDDEMKALFGDQYIGGNDTKETGNEQ